MTRDAKFTSKHVEDATSLAFLSKREIYEKLINNRQREKLINNR